MDGDSVVKVDVIPGDCGAGGGGDGDPKVVMKVVAHQYTLAPVVLPSEPDGALDVINREPELAEAIFHPKEWRNLCGHTGDQHNR